jgi:uncharacterized protein with HEPN domain
MPGRRDERLYLSVMLQAIDRALDYTRIGRDAFMQDARSQDAVIRNMTVLGEAVRGISDATRQAHPEIPWNKISGTRDRVIDGYFVVDLDIVWDIAEHELPRLRHQVAELLPIIKRSQD